MSVVASQPREPKRLALKPPEPRASPGTKFRREGLDHGTQQLSGEFSRGLPRAQGGPIGSRLAGRLLDSGSFLQGLG
jgi:hypothetical protein